MPKYAKLPDASDDFGHEETDRILGRMEKKISKEYKQAEKELTEKLEKYLERFEAKDKVKRKQLAEGVITQDEYNRWRIGQVATGERWKAMRDTIAEEITKANDIAKSTINSHAEEVYSLNHNYAVFQAEKDAMIDTSYTLYNRRATEELFKNKKSLLPAPKEGSKAWKAAHNKDLRWNQQKINSSLIQGLLQGDSIPQIAKRLKDVVGMNKVSAVRNARTMTTGVENRARDDAVNDLRKKGIELDSVWIATLDNRTRHSHRLLHGEIKDLKTGKYSNGCRYPADPQGKPQEVYNCRCSQRSNVRGFPIDIPRWSPKMGDMTFEEWLGEHENVASVATKNTPISAIMNARNFNDLQVALAERYGLSFDDSVRKLDFEAVKPASIGVATIIDEFPNAKEMFKGLSTNNNGMMCASFSGLINFNPKYFTDKKVIESKMKEGAESGFHPKNATVLGCAAHEAGHILERMLIQIAHPRATNDLYERSSAIEEWNKCKQAQRVISEACKRAKKTPEGKGLNNATLKSNVSMYAMKNASECLAECVCDYTDNRNNANILSRMVWDVLKEELG